MSQSARKSYGPFKVTTAAGPVPAEFFATDWAEVKGGLMMVGVVDDIDNNPIIAGVTVPAMLTYSEVSIYGVIQGYDTLLKLACISGKTGPFNYIVPWEEGYERLSFRQRIMAGGRPLTPPFTGPNPPGFPQMSQANINLNVYFFPRGGFGKVANG